MYDVELRILPLPQILLVQYVWRSKPFAALQKLQKILYIQNMSHIADALLCTKWVFELQFTKNHFSFGFDLCDNNNIATFCATNAMYLIITNIIFMWNMSYLWHLGCSLYFFSLCVCMCIYTASSMKWPWTSGAWGPWDNYHLRMFICASVCLNICMFLCLRVYDHIWGCAFLSEFIGL